MTLIKDWFISLFILFSTGKTQRWIEQVFYQITHLQLEEWVEFEKFSLIAYGTYAEIKVGTIQYAFNEGGNGLSVHINIPDKHAGMPYTEVYRRRKCIKEVRWIQTLKELNSALISNNAYQLRAKELQAQQSSG